MLDAGVVTDVVPPHEAADIVVVRRRATDPEVQAPGDASIGVGLDVLLTVGAVRALPDGEQVARVPDGVADALAHEHDAHVTLTGSEQVVVPVVALPEEEATLAGRIECRDGLLDDRVVHVGGRAVHGLVDDDLGGLHDLLGGFGDLRLLDLGSLGVRVVEGHRHGGIRATGGGDDEEGKELTSHGGPPAQVNYDI